MSSDRIKTIIIHNDVGQAKEIQAAMPDYVDASFSRFTDAKEKLAAGIDGEKIGLVIMNADEEDGKALSVFKYMKEDPEKIGLRIVPVILLAADEFAPHCMDFFDIADPRFYTGSVEDSDFFMEINDALDEAEMLADSDDLDDEPVKEVVPKTAEKLMGTVYKIDTSNADSMRIAAYGDETLIGALNSAVSDGKEKVKQVYEVLEAVAAESAAKGEEVDFATTPRKYTIPKAVEKSPISKWKKKDENIVSVHNIKDANKVSELLREDDAKATEDGKASVLARKAIPQETKSKWENRAQGNVQSNVYKQPALNNMNPGMNNMRHATNANVNADNAKRVVLIVDTDPNTLKAFNLFLGDGYKIEMVESSMKALDFVVRNRVDLVAVEYVLQGVSGLSVVKSIKNQPAGMRAKVLILAKDTTPEVVLDKIRNTPGVAGIIKKPIVKKQLLGAIR